MVWEIIAEEVGFKKESKWFRGIAYKWEYKEMV